MAAQQVEPINGLGELDFGMLHQELLEKGFTVIPSVVSPENCDLLKSQVQEWLGTFPEGKFPMTTNSIIHNYGIGQSEPMWRARGLVKHVFARIWNTEKLLTSFDGMAVGQPPEEGREKFYDGKTHGLHCDQAPRKLGLHAYQGALYLEGAEEDDWCFKVISHSHKLHTEFFRENKRGSGSEFRRLSNNEIIWFTSRDCQVLKVAVPKGGMVLWDSRLIHAGQRPMPGRADAGKWRFVMFISMTPAIWARPQDLQAKRQAYRDINTTTHWSSQGVLRHNMEKTTRAEQNVVQLPPSALTPEARLLAGVEDYNFSDGRPNGPKSMPKWT